MPASNGFVGSWSGQPNHLCSRWSGDCNGRAPGPRAPASASARGVSAGTCEQVGMACALVRRPPCHGGSTTKRRLPRPRAPMCALAEAHVSIPAPAREAGISRERRPVLPGAERPPERTPSTKSVRRLPSKWTGTETDSDRHRTRGEMPCCECRRGPQTGRRGDGPERRRAGIPKPLEGPGTTGAWRRLQRQGVPMDEWGEANRTAHRDADQRLET